MTLGMTDCCYEHQAQSHGLLQEHTKTAPLMKSPSQMSALSGGVNKGDIFCDLCKKYEKVDNHCVECNKDMCSVCKHHHLRAKVSAKHHPISLKLWESHTGILQCPIHSDSFTTLYCDFCQKMVCDMCGKNQNTNDPRPCFSRSKKEEMMCMLDLYKKGKLTLEGLTFEECHLLEECLIEDQFIQSELVDKVKARIHEEVEQNRSLIAGYQEKFEAWYQKICQDFVAKMKKYTKKAENYHGKELIRLYRFAENDMNRPREHVQPLYNIPSPEFVPGKPGVGSVEESFGKLVYDDLNIQWRKHIMLYNLLCAN